MIIEKALNEHKNIDALLAVGPHICELADQIAHEKGRSMHVTCFDLSPTVLKDIQENRITFTVDQQQRLRLFANDIPLSVPSLWPSTAQQRYPYRTGFCG